MYASLAKPFSLIARRIWEMNQKFGGGPRPTWTPLLAWSCFVVIVSLLAGTSVVHNIFKPNLVSVSSPPSLSLFLSLSLSLSSSISYRSPAIILPFLSYIICLSPSLSLCLSPLSFSCYYTTVFSYFYKTNKYNFGC